MDTPRTAPSETQRSVPERQVDPRRLGVCLFMELPSLTERLEDRKFVFRRFNTWVLIRFLNMSFLRRF